MKYLLNYLLPKKEQFFTDAHFLLLFNKASNIWVSVEVLRINHQNLSKILTILNKCSLKITRNMVNDVMMCFSKELLTNRLFILTAFTQFSGEA